MGAAARRKTLRWTCSYSPVLNLEGGFAPDRRTKGRMLFDRPIQAVPGDLPRKWLVDDCVELVVWFEEDGGIFGFQFHYDLKNAPKAFTFTKAAGFSHNLIDTGEDVPEENSTPILAESIPVNISEVEHLFRDRSENLPESLRWFVFDHILEFKREH